MLPGVHSPKTNDWKGWNLNMIIFSCQAATSEKCEWGMAEKTWGPPSYYELKLKLYSKWDFNQKGLKIIYTSYIIPSWSPINWDCEPGRPWQKNPPTSWSALFIALIFNEVFRWKGNDGKFENKVPLKMADSGALATWTPTSHSWHRWFIAYLKVNCLEMKKRCWNSPIWNDQFNVGVTHFDLPPSWWVSDSRTIRWVYKYTLHRESEDVDLSPSWLNGNCSPQEIIFRTLWSDLLAFKLRG